MDNTLANQYETNLANLIKDIRAKASRADLPVILPMIDPQPAWTYSAKVRAADVALTAKLANTDTMDTKGLPTDNVHYKAAGMVIIGQRSALRWLKMKYPPPAVSLVRWAAPNPYAFPAPLFLRDVLRIDIAGRRVDLVGIDPQRTSVRRREGP
jgi:hypothetical protein